MNPFIDLYRNPVALLSTVAWVLVTLSIAIPAAYGATINAVNCYDDYVEAGWESNPTWPWVLKAASVPLGYAVLAAILAAMVELL